MQCKSDGNMEDVATEKDCSPPPIVSESQESPDVRTTESAENFQKFMHNLFEQNGVMNDLRAYLRGHIVGILRSTRSGDPPPCQKNFTQRLELPYQALNMLLAEYLMQMEFNYTLSVFISEIPLANMVLDFARSLMQGNYTNTLLKFKDEDVWSILNYLGVKCDSDHASKIVKMYKEDTECQSPLLLCMLKSMPLYTPIEVEKDSSQDSLSSSVKSSETGAGGSRLPPSRCKHLVFCKTCHGHMLKMKEKYRKKKKTLTENMKHSSAMPQNVESLMKNIDVVERDLIDEMFQQLKSVYETEVQMAKAEEEERVKRTLTNHAVQFKMKRIALEESFKARELELARSVQQKKRFLWGLARLLRDQHQQMARAMMDVQTETSRLSAKENSLKSQLAEAEAVLRSRGEEMRQQISDELAILEKHLDSIKTERDTINKARTELEQMKNLCENEKTNNVETSKEDLRSHYDLLKIELNILKKYLKYAKIEPKVVMERSTITEDDLNRIDGVLNNGQDLDRSKSEDRVKAKRVVNDLKKMKNVNFVQSKLAEIYDERVCSSPSRSTESSEAGDTHVRDTRDTRDVARRDALDVTQLLEENERLRTFARQQREHIDELSSQQARLQAELTAARLPPPAPTPRPRTAPAAMPPDSLLHRMSTSSGHGWCKGAGEEMSFFVNAQPRILVPGDTLPFIGLVRDRHNDSRRYLINQWRSLRRRISPVNGGLARTHAHGTDTLRDKESPFIAGPSVHLPLEPDDVNDNENQESTLNHAHKCSRDQSNEQASKSSEKSSVKSRDKGHTSLLREAKERLKTKDKQQCSEREPSPSAVLRDARRRLRRLEIEAEAVERSYLDFRRTRDAKRTERRVVCDTMLASGTENVKHDRPSLNTDVSAIESTSRYVIQKPTVTIIENIEEFNSKYDIGGTHLRNSNATPVRMRAMSAESPIYKASKTKNLLETSMPEFRKYYQCEKRPANEDFIEERLRASQTRNRDFERQRSQSVNLKQGDEDRPPSPVHRTRRASSDVSDSPRASLPHNVESIERNDPNPLKNRVPSPIQGNADVYRARSPKIIIKGHRTDVRQSKHPKAKELEILKQNINKIYNLSETENTTENENHKAVENASWEIKEEIADVIEETNEVSQDEVNKDPVNKDLGDDKNVLRIEVQSVTQVNDVKLSESQTQDLMLIVESSNVTEPSDTEFPQEVISTQMTILVSPKRSISEKIPEDNGGEKSIDLNGRDVLNSLYQASPNENKSSVQMNSDNSKDVLIPFHSDLEINEEDDNSLRYDSDRDRSPVSMAKTSEDENFWDN